MVSMPEDEAKGGSPGAVKVQPVCVSSESLGRVLCHVECTTDKPITSSRPCAIYTPPSLQCIGN